VNDSEPRSAQALPCVCGDPESDHQWRSKATPALTWAGPCAHQVQLPREGDEPEVRYRLCPCRQYYLDRSLLRPVAE
jgi:hypothetical protein